MSTKCNIIVDGNDTMVVRLSDGYPDGRTGVLFLLKPLVQKFLAGRGYLDGPYLTAHVAHRCIENLNRDRARERRKRAPGTADHLKGPDLINIRVQPFVGKFSPDAAFVYRIVTAYTLGRGDHGAAIEVYRRNSNAVHPTLEDYLLVRKMPV